ncbi:MAG: RNA 2'-phosphotransferase [Armatimonadetes bacterium]|nr:RNA 2'-phosphotransferase [Armatimonadota bacterium]
MLSEKEVKRVSKFMSFVLRHDPECIGLSVDANGWAEVDELISCANAGGRTLTREIVDEVVARNDKKRFVVSEDGRRIRAAQGHSIEVDLQLEPREPPEILFHGTTQHYVESILASGVNPGSRRHVHLSPDEETARKVGSRHGKPSVLRIRAGEMWKAGYVFYLSENGVWLTDEVPLEFIERA